MVGFVDYMGLKLKNPVIVASGPWSRNAEGIQRAIDAGAAAVVTETISLEESFELSPRIYKQNGNLLNIPFREYLPLAQLHWMIADRDSCITVESMADGLHIYDNPVGAMTNNPPFPYQLFALNNYRHLGVDTPGNTFGTELNAYSRGLGGLGLPGDLSSQSRFVRVTFTKLNSLCEAGEMSAVSQFFHILGSVDQQRGLCRLKENEYEITLYTCCCNLSKGTYYYTTYDNHQITAVDMHRENLDGDMLICYQPVTGEQVRYMN